MFSIIAAIGKNRELGFKNQLVFKIKADMEFFKQTTLGHPVIMGRKTFESIGRPLPGRKNYVVTRHAENLPDTVEIIPDLKTFLDKHQDTPEEFFVIGGASIYESTLPYAKNLYLTEIDADAPADTFFPEFNRENYSREIITKGKENDLTYQFVHYKYNG